MWYKILFAVLLFKIISALVTVNYISPEDDVTFHLYHQSDFTTYDRLFIGNVDSVKKSRFDPRMPTKIIVHGWTHGKDVPWVIEMREAMAKVGQWNVIVIDWAPLSHSMYLEARQHTPIVSKELTKFLIFLCESFAYPMSLVHLIGHSMGGQISGYTGYLVQQNQSQKIGRITGLDPASPLYEFPDKGLDEVLDETDADFVDVIHTNAGHLGMLRPAGHVDFYPNGGELQPGCGFWICSHMRSCEYWTASVKNPELFKAYPYEKWDTYVTAFGTSVKPEPVPMGIAVGPQVPSGSYILETNFEEQNYLETKSTIFDGFYSLLN